MAKSFRNLRRRQLDNFFDKYRDSFFAPRPGEGWIKEIKSALGMSSADLANRMGVVRQRIDRLEKDEVSGKVTLESIKKAAEALGCEFVYILVPLTSLQKQVNDQALIAAKQLAGEVEHSMKLENQGTTKKAQKALVEDLANEMVQKDDRRIWKVK
jgi:predicted DNA-binding mobile mystery protein A